MNTNAAPTSSSTLTSGQTGRQTVPELDLVVGDTAEVIRRCAAFREVFSKLMSEIGRVIVGQEETVRMTLVGLFANGHVLLEGVPGLGKTLLVKTLADALNLPFNRIQFTPDLMPADIVGTTVVMENRSTGRRFMAFRKGPIFAQVILADEINRATPKTQAALLEAMQERRVTVAGVSHALAQPFLVLATQNPIEQEGTYTLPEAQLDRFLLKIVVPYASRSEINRILERTTSSAQARINPVLDGAHILQAQRLVKRVIVGEHVQDYAIRLVLATHPTADDAPAVSRRYIRVGVSPRGAQALILAAKVQALIAGRYHVAFHDIAAVAHAALRHRVLVNFEAEADLVTSDDVIAQLLKEIQHEPEEGAPLVQL